MMEIADMSNLKFDGESREGASPSIPIHPFYKTPEWKIYGPYQSKKDLRRRVIAYNGKNKITISYPKYLMECFLQRQLLDNEEVHHKNNLEFDDRIDNYEIINQAKHKAIHSKITPEIFVCPVCNNHFQLTVKQMYKLKSNQKRNPIGKGPYCSKSCCGKENN